jgi:hypothetical protein
MKAEKKRPEVALGKRLAVSNNFPHNNAHTSESQQKPCLACALWPVVKRLREERIAREAAGLEFGEVLP